MASQYSGRGRTAEGLRWIAAAFTIATAALAVRRLIGDRDQVDDTPPVSKAFTVNRSPDDVALLWQEIDPVGDIVEHVRFDLAPGDRGTEVRVQFHPRWFGRRSPARVQEQLRQFKQLAETGEIARTGIGRGVPRYGDMPEGAVLEELLVRGAR
jgi:hypothetical protein